MSSMDQVFVKAFSRRRLAESDRDVRRQPAQPHEVIQTSADLDSDSQFGSLELNHSVAGTAEVWVDPVEDQIARPDHASCDVPKPHVDRALPVDRTVTFELPKFDTRIEEVTHERVEDRASGVDAADFNDGKFHDSPIAHPGPLQHTHTAYAGAFADPSLVGAAIESSVAAAPEDTVALREVVEPKNAIAAQVFKPTDVLEREDVVSDHDRFVADMRFDPPAAAAPVTPVPAATTPVATTPVATPDAAASYVPFQPVWEVDVFDVPSPVADLFFEGALFQQIAERMSDAVSSGLKTVLVTSAKPGEGRSCVAIGMAMAAAAAGIRVALVDADTESPSLADELRLDLQYGWVDVIRRGLPIKEIAVQAVEDGVTLIPLMPPGVRPAAKAFEIVQLVDLLTNNFELIILDGPTSLSAGLQQCASRVDSAVIVRDVSRTDDLAVCELTNRLQSAGVRGVGVVENFI